MQQLQRFHLRCKFPERQDRKAGLSPRPVRRRLLMIRDKPGKILFPAGIRSHSGHRAAHGPRGCQNGAAERAEPGPARFSAKTPERPNQDHGGGKCRSRFPRNDALFYIIPRLKCKFLPIQIVLSIQNSKKRGSSSECVKSLLNWLKLVNLAWHYLVNLTWR